MRSRVQVSLPLQRSDFYHSFFCSGERPYVTHPLNPPPVRGTYLYTQHNGQVIFITPFFCGGERPYVTHPLNPPDLRSSSLRLGRVCEHSLLSLRSVSPCEGDLFIYAFIYAANAPVRGTYLYTQQTQLLFQVMMPKAALTSILV